MGCSSSKDGDRAPPIASSRRRLSLGDIDAGPGDRDESVKEEDRAMLMQLNQQQVFDFVRASPLMGGRKYSVGSETDMGMHNVNAFSSKTARLTGDAFDPKKERIGYACKKGLKPESPNQDSFFIMKIEGQYSIYGVFDGHGRKGHDVSNFVKDNLPKIILSQEELLRENPTKALEVSFEKMQVLIEKATNMKTIDALRSGTTASVVLQDHQKGMLHIAYVGDSRVVLGRQQGNLPKGGQPFWAAVDLSIDHKPELPEERARIEKAGGMVVFDGGWNYRVYVKGRRDARGKRYPGLNMSRSMGDLAGFHDAGISATPDVSQLSMGPTGNPLPAAGKDPVPATPTPPGAPLIEGGESPDGQGGRRGSGASSGSMASKPSVASYSIQSADRFVLLCSDGVWEFVSSQEAVQSVARFYDTEAMDAAGNLASTAWKRWIHEMNGEVVDDITAVVVHLK